MRRGTTRRDARASRASRRARRAAGPLVVAGILAATTGLAAAERLAVVIGNNDGDRQDGALRYAEDDATRLADALTSVAGFAAGDVVTLRGGGADDARRTLLAWNERLRAGPPGEESMLFVYYSGHGDDRALHLGESALALAELEGLVRSSPARFRVLVVDACRSGALTRRKGGRAAPPIQLAARGELASEGVVILTAASAGEDAQESDALQGSFFTHHLVSALRGAADANGDEAVTLSELYRYAYDNTLRDSSRTLYGVQHPAYRYDIRGAGDITVSRLRDRGAQGLLAVPPDVDVLLFAGAGARRVAAEYRRTDHRGALLVRPGAYLVRARGARTLWEGQVVVARGQEVALDLGRLERVEYARLARKGAAAPPAVGLGAALTAQRGLTSAAPCLGGAVGLELARGAVVIGPRVGACAEEFANASLRARTLVLDAGLGLRYAASLPRRLAASVGPELGVAALRQAFATAEGASATATANRLAGPYVGVAAGLAWDLPHGLTPSAFVFARTYVLPVERPDAAAVVAALFTVGGGVALTAYF